jgi:hypothetical protein
LKKTDPENLPERALAAAIAIYNRRQELVSSSNSPAESEAMERACRQLMKIKTEQLKLPGLNFLRAARHISRTKPYHSEKGDNRGPEENQSLQWQEFSLALRPT